MPADSLAAAPPAENKLLRIAVSTASSLMGTMFADSNRSGFFGFRGSRRAETSNCPGLLPEAEIESSSGVSEEDSFLIPSRLAR
jgi:hypothetical protein